jgi:thioesterase domain-containing protein
MAQQLHRQGKEAALLAMIDSSAGFRHIGSQVGLAARARLHFHNLSQLGPAQQATYLKKFLQRQMSTAARKIRRKFRQVTRKQQPADYWHTLPPPLHHALLRQNMYQDYPKHGLTIPTGRRHLMNVHELAMKFYIPRLYPGRIILFPNHQRGPLSYLKPQLGWARLAGKGIEINPMPGDHNTLLDEPHARILAEKLNAYLGPTKNPAKTRGL